MNLEKSNSEGRQRVRAKILRRKKKIKKEKHQEKHQLCYATASFRFFFFFFFFTFRGTLLIQIVESIKIYYSCPLPGFVRIGGKRLPIKRWIRSVGTCTPAPTRTAIYFANITNDFRRSRSNAITGVGRRPEMLQWEIKFLTNSITFRCVRRCRKVCGAKGEGCYVFAHAALPSEKKKKEKRKKRKREKKERKERKGREEKWEKELNENEQFATSAEAPVERPAVVNWSARTLGISRDSE